MGCHLRWSCLQGYVCGPRVASPPPAAPPSHQAWSLHHECITAAEENHMHLYEAPHQSGPSDLTKCMPGFSCSGHPHPFRARTLVLTPGAAAHVQHRSTAGRSSPAVDAPLYHQSPLCARMLFLAGGSMWSPLSVRVCTRAALPSGGHYEQCGCTGCWLSSSRS